jgi:cytochrome c553
MLFVASVTSVAYAQDAAGDAKAGETKIAMCIGCHGIKGYQASFPEVYKVPMISGQTASYIVSSLTAYQKGDRKHPTMRGISETLTEQNMADLGAYYSGHGVVEGQSAPKEVKAPSAQVAALLGKANCSSCHGANFSKPISDAYPKLAGQHADYLYVALKSYQSNAPTHGRSNGIMQGQVKRYSHAELKAMAKYLGSLPGELKTVPQSRFR